MGYKHHGLNMGLRVGEQNLQLPVQYVKKVNEPYFGRFGLLL